MSLRQVTPNMDNGSVNQGGEHGGTVALCWPYCTAQCIRAVIKDIF
jgi:hypothetical protein